MSVNLFFEIVNFPSFTILCGSLICKILLKRFPWMFGQYDMDVINLYLTITVEQWFLTLLGCGPLWNPPVMARELL